MALYQRGRIWYADFYTNGQRIQESTGTANKREAEKFLAARIADVGRGSFVKTPRISLAEFGRRYMDYAKVNKRSWLRDEQMIKHLTAYFDPCTLTDIGPLAVEQYKLHRSQCVSAATVNRETALLKRLYNLADCWGLFQGRNPVKGVKFLRENNIKLRILTEEEEQRLLLCCPGYLADLVLFAINTGLRSGDIYRLKWEGINETNQIMSVHIRKTDRIIDIPLNAAALDVLKRWAAIRRGPYVFYNQITGDRFHDVKASLQKAVKQAGLPPTTFHAFRHTFASRLVRESVDIVTVKELLGHASIRMTMRYAHTGQATKRDAVARLGGVKVVTPITDKES